MIRLILGMIRNLKMGSNQAIFVGLHFHPPDVTRGGGMVYMRRLAEEGRALAERSMAGEQWRKLMPLYKSREKNDWRGHSLLLGYSSWELMIWAKLFCLDESHLALPKEMYQILDAQMPPPLWSLCHSPTVLSLCTLLVGCLYFSQRLFIFPCSILSYSCRCY